MIRCTYYDRVGSGEWIKSEDVELSVDRFLSILKDYEMGEINILEASIGDFKLDCNRLSQLLIL